ncbi:MAG: hypothetical protein ACRDK2_10140 [Solirubrobacteraceae bacterium]
MARLAGAEYRHLCSSTFVWRAGSASIQASLDPDRAKQAMRRDVSRVFSEHGIEAQIPGVALDIFCI